VGRVALVSEHEVGIGVGVLADFILNGAADEVGGGTGGGLGDSGIEGKGKEREQWHPR